MKARGAAGREPPAARGNGAPCDGRRGSMDPHPPDGPLDRERVSIQAPQLAGFAALREVHHLVHLYVTAPLQRRGLGRAQWEHLRRLAAADGAREFYVNAWRDAVPVYRRLGFEPLGPTVKHLGVPRQPMILHRFR